MVGLLVVAQAAAVSLRSDPIQDERPTHCRFYFDEQDPIETPVATEAGGVYCLLDISDIAVGFHTVQATFAVNDEVWGEMESPKSVPFEFSRPAGPTGSPSGLKLLP
jgi:hypothetical protein